jgi:cathepsin B
LLSLYRSVDAYSPGSLVTDIMLEMMSHGPVEATFWVYTDFLNYKGGVYIRQKGAALLGGHAVKIIGWGVEEVEGGQSRSGGGGMEYWLVVNSWGVHWGEHGLFRIRKGTNECGIEDEIAAGIPRLSLEH